MSNETVYTYVNIDESGITVGGFIGEDDSPTFERLHTWSEVFQTEMEYVCIPSGPIIVDGHNDGVKDLLQLVDILRKAADNLEDKIKSSKILIRDNLIDGRPIDAACVSFSKYMRGEYS